MRIIDRKKNIFKLA